jgi:hypothetical protein
LRKNFAAWYPPSPEQREEFVVNGLVALDANILLDLYRMNPDARQDLLSLLHRLETHLWVPHQAALEFHRNRLNVIYDQEQIIGQIRKDVTAAKNKLMAEADGLRHHPVIDRQKFTDAVAAGFSLIDDYLDGIKNEPLLSIRTAASEDPILDAITELLDGKVGQKYEADRQKRVTEEGRKRIEAKQPPGYADAKKGDDRAVGDYILWRQLLDEAARRKKPVLLITNDQKEDWYLRLHGLTIGPRIELVEEMRTESDVPFTAETLARFVDTAPARLKSTVKDITVSEVKRLDDERQAGARAEIAYVSESGRPLRPPSSRRGQWPAEDSTRRLLELSAEIDQLELRRVRTEQAVQAATEALAEARAKAGLADSGEESDPRSYMRALEYQLDDYRAERAAIEDALAQRRRDLSPNSDTTSETDRPDSRS